jgi:hypothetical protein
MAGLYGTVRQRDALYESDLVMVDRSTGSYWWQVAGEAIVGQLTGTRLEPLASSVATWEELKSLHPDTRILSGDTGSSRPYEQDPFASFSDQIDAGGVPVSRRRSRPRRSTSRVDPGGRSCR